MALVFSEDARFVEPRAGKPTFCCFTIWCTYIVLPAARREETSGLELATLRQRAASPSARHWKIRPPTKSTTVIASWAEMRSLSLEED
jgi:hypothetical protein